jgi:predicted ATP-dependent endonuclease of OLD family
VDKIKSGSQISQVEASRIYQYRSLFLNIVQNAFSQTGKTIIDNKSRIEFKLSDGTLIHSDSLSSGEKQFLIIMLTVLLEKGQDYILLMDEPEISMHYEWQSKLIENILKLNPNCQIILSTHSPALIMDGWEQSVMNIDKIKSHNG